MRKQAKTYNSDAGVRNSEVAGIHSDSGANAGTFKPGCETLVWLEEFATGSKIHLGGEASVRNLQSRFPWLWAPDWHLDADVSPKGVNTIRSALLEARAMERSLRAFLGSVTDRVQRFEATLDDIAPKAYFPLLPDDVLAIIFEFASLPFSQATGNLYDNKTPDRIAQVSRRFRNIAMKVPHFWRYIHVNSDVAAIAARSKISGPILEARVKSENTNWDQRIDDLLSFMKCIASHSSKISVLRFDLSPRMEEDFFKRIHNQKKLASLSFPALHELVLDYKDMNTKCRSLHFYKKWDMPSLKILKCRNIIPDFHSEALLSGISECEFAINEYRSNNDKWELPKVLRFLSLLSGLSSLDLLLDGRVTKESSHNFSGVASLRGVQRLRTAFPGISTNSAVDFCSKLSTPNKTHWKLELQPEDYYIGAWQVASDLKCILTGSGPMCYGGFGAPDEASSARLKNLDIVYHRDIKTETCAGFADLNKWAPSLERISVVYVTVAEQLRRIELNGCKNRLKGMTAALRAGFEESLGIDRPLFAIDGSNVLENGPETT